MVEGQGRPAHDESAESEDSTPMGQPMRYEIVVKGRGGPAVMAALEGFEPAESARGETRLVGWVIDQAALHAILERLRDLNIELRDVHRIDVPD